MADQKPGAAIWILRFFIAFVGTGLVYMIATRESIRMEFGSAESRSYSLQHHPVSFAIVFVAMAVFEWALIRVHAEMQRRGTAEKSGRRRR